MTDPVLPEAVRQAISEVEWACQDEGNTRSTKTKAFAAEMRVELEAAILAYGQQCRNEGIEAAEQGLLDEWRG